MSQSVSITIEPLDVDLSVCKVEDFSLIGILAGISSVLAENKIGLFAVSTFNTDYILTKEEHFERALDVLRNAGYIIKGI